MTRSGSKGFLLKSVYAGGGQTQARLHALKDIAGTWTMGRRGFLATTGVALSALPGVSSWAAQAEKPLEHEDSPCGEEITAHRGEIRSLSMSGDGRYLVSESAADGVKLWEMPSGRLIRDMGEYTGVERAAFGPRGAVLVLVQGRGLQVFRNPEGGADLKLSGPAGFADIAFSPDGGLLAGGCGDGTVLIHQTESGHHVHTLTDPAIHRVDCLAMDPLGRVLAAGTDAGIAVWKLKDGSLAGFIADRPLRTFTRLLFDPLGVFIISTSSSAPHVTLWDAGSGKSISRTDLAKPPGKGLSIGPEGRLFVGSDQKSTWLLDLPSLRFGKLLDQQVSAMAVSPDGQVMAVGGIDRRICLFDVPGNECRTCLFDPKSLEKGREANAYEYTDQYGRRMTGSLPCGAAIPPGAICTCNCVPGSFTIPVPTSGGTICTCNKICTCEPIK